MHDDLLVTDLVARAGKGEKQAWDALVERYSPLSVFSTAWRTRHASCRRIDRAEDWEWVAFKRPAPEFLPKLGR